MYYKIKPNYYFHKYLNKIFIAKNANANIKINYVHYDILQLCNGENTYNDILEQISKAYNFTIIDKEAVNVLNNCLQNLIDKELIELVEEKTYIKPRLTGIDGKCMPFFICLELTNKCNNKCTFCYMDGNKDMEEMSNENIDKIIHNFSGVTPLMQITGGEPLAHSNATEILDKLSQHFALTMVTNGTLLKNIPDNILLRFNNIQVSCYGNNETTYEQTAKRKNGYNLFLNGIKKLNKINANYSVSLVITKDNHTVLEEYIKSFISSNVKIVRFGLCLPIGRENITGNSSFLNAEEEKLVFKTVNLLTDKYKDQIKILPFKNITSTKPKLKDNNTLSCGGGKTNITINPQGKIRPCIYFPSNKRNLPLDQYLELINKGCEAQVDSFVMEFKNELNKYNHNTNEMKCTGFCEV